MNKNFVTLEICNGPRFESLFHCLTMQYWGEHHVNFFLEKQVTVKNQEKPIVIVGKVGFIPAGISYVKDRRFFLEQMAEQNLYPFYDEAIRQNDAQEILRAMVIVSGTICVRHAGCTIEATRTRIQAGWYNVASRSGSLLVDSSEPSFGYFQAELIKSYMNKHNLINGDILASA